MEKEFIPMPRLGDKAPAFDAATTQGDIHFPEDFKDRWVILFSHPSDFTPVCTSEFITFGKMLDEFERLNCRLVGLSVDGLASHIAWLRTIEEKIGFRDIRNIEIRFPLIEDLSMTIANRYGMIQPGESDTKAVRAVFFIDPEATIRTILYYPLSLGRNFEEIKRILIGLQTIDAFGVSLPADWKPGEQVVMPAPKTCPDAKNRMEDTSGKFTREDWFFCLRDLPEDSVKKKLKVEEF